MASDNRYGGSAKRKGDPEPKTPAVGRGAAPTANGRRLRFAALAAALLVGLLAAACGGGGSGESGGGGGQEEPAAALDPAELKPEDIVGKGPNGEEPASPEEVQLTEEEAARAKEEKFQVGIVMQTMDIDWSKLQVEGITKTLEANGAEVVGVTDANFEVEKQVADIENMIQKRPDAIISIPVDDTATAEAYKKVSDAGIELVFIHQPPKGLEHPADYASVISPDNQGNGQVAAQILSEYIPEGGSFGIIDFGVDFFTTNQRTIAVKDWLKENRPDIEVKEADFLDPTDAESVSANFLTANPDVNGLFVIWDAPAMGAVTAQREQGTDVPITTIDLGNEVAIELAQGGLIKGLSAQEPYEQGVAEANATLKALLGEETPPWIALPAVPVLQENVLEAYEQVFHKPPPTEVVEACESSGGCNAG
jgi:ribose transport system substrate-binding protein